MIKLTYNKLGNIFENCTVIGTVESIQDLYWQLTRNYASNDGTSIQDIAVSNLNGDVIVDVMADPYSVSISG